MCLPVATLRWSPSPKRLTLCPLSRSLHTQKRGKALSLLRGSWMLTLLRYNSSYQYPSYCRQWWVHERIVTVGGGGGGGPSSLQGLVFLRECQLCTTISVTYTLFPPLFYFILFFSFRGLVYYYRICISTWFNYCSPNAHMQYYVLTITL